jgi:hypothetical protein
MKNGKKKKKKKFSLFATQNGKALLCATNHLLNVVNSTWVGLAHKCRIIYLFLNLRFMVVSFLILNFLAYT